MPSFIPPSLMPYVIPVEIMEKAADYGAQASTHATGYGGYAITSAPVLASVVILSLLWYGYAWSQKKIRRYEQEIRQSAPNALPHPVLTQSEAEEDLKNQLKTMLAQKR